MKTIVNYVVKNKLTGKERYLKHTFKGHLSNIDIYQKLNRKHAGYMVYPGRIQRI